MQSGRCYRGVESFVLREMERMGSATYRTECHASPQASGRTANGNTLPPRARMGLGTGRNAEVADSIGDGGIVRAPRMSSAHPPARNICVPVGGEPILSPGREAVNSIVMDVGELQARGADEPKRAEEIVSPGTDHGQPRRADSSAVRDGRPESRFQRQGVARLNGRHEWSEKMRDAIGVIAHERTPSGQHQIPSRRFGEDPAHP